MLGTLLTSLTSLRDFLSRAFFLGAFLPTLLFTFLNFLTLYLWNWPVHDWLENELLKADATHRVVVFAALFLGLWIGSYVVGALTPYWQRMLEGRTWRSNWVRNRGIRYQRARYNELTKGINSSFATYSRIDKRRPAWKQLLDNAAAAAQPPYGAGVSQRTTNSLERLKQAQLDHQLISYEDLNAAHEHLTTDVLALGDTDEIKNLGEDLTHLTIYADERAQSEHSRLFMERNLNFGDTGEIAPTQFGNVGLSAQGYAMRAYRCNLPQIWGALRQAAQNDQKLAPALEDSKMQLDFLVASFFLFDVWALSWAIAFACYGSWLLAAGLAFLGPLIGWGVWYGAAVERYRVMQDLITSLLDSLRFQVLTNSHLNTPIDLEEERELWRALDISVGAGETRNLRYRQSAS